MNQINFSEDLEQFFTNSNERYRSIERIKLFFSKYKEFVTGIKYYNNNKNEFTLKWDSESEVWLEQTYVLHAQAEIFNIENLVQENRKFNYYHSVLNKKTNEIIGNIVVTVDYLKSQKSEMTQLKASEKMLFSLIEEMPVGVIIHNKNQEIIKANKVAASQYSYINEADMKGKIFGDFVNIESKVVRSNDESEFGTILSKQLIELMGGELSAVSPSGISGNLGTKLSGSFIMLMISTNDKKGNYMKCITMGIDHYLIKPFDISDLLNIVNNSFTFIDDPSSLVEIGTIRDDIKILIIVDNKMNQKVIGTMLKILGYSFDLADNGYAGYLQSKIRKYDLIFMDLIMPEMDGFESAQKILEYDKEILIVAFTADNMSESRRKAELSGIKDFIAKPIRIEGLKKLFARHFKR